MRWLGAPHVWHLPTKCHFYKQQRRNYIIIQKEKILNYCNVFISVKERAIELGGSATFLTEFGICEPNATLTNSTGKDLFETLVCSKNYKIIWYNPLFGT